MQAIDWGEAFCQRNDLFTYDAAGTISRAFDYLTWEIWTESGALVLRRDEVGPFMIDTVFRGYRPKGDASGLWRTEIYGPTVFNGLELYSGTLHDALHTHETALFIVLDDAATPL